MTQTSDLPYKRFDAMLHTEAWPRVDIELANGQVIRGAVVPEHIAPDWPGPFAAQVWSNPLFPPLEKETRDDADG